MKGRKEKWSVAFFWSHRSSSLGQGVSVVHAEQGSETLGLLS